MNEQMNRQDFNSLENCLPNPSEKIYASSSIYDEFANANLDVSLQFTSHRHHFHISIWQLSTHDVVATSLASHPMLPLCKIDTLSPG